MLETPVVAIGDFKPQHPDSVVYTPGVDQLSRLYLDLICGRPLPLTLILREVRDLAQVVSCALFMDREMALHPRALTLVTAVELSLGLQEGGQAHVDRDLARLLNFIEAYMFPAPANRRAFSQKLASVLGWLRPYVLQGTLPSLPRAADPPRILDQGTNGFVLAETGGPISEGVVELYRAGHLRGLLFGPGSTVVAFKKSHLVAYNLDKAHQQLQQIVPEENWRLLRCQLASPSAGTLLPREALVQLFLRV